MSTDTSTSTAVSDPTPARLAPRAIDLVGVDDVTELLGISRADLLASVEAGEIAAYDLDGRLRFRALEVATLAATRHLDGAA